MKTKNSRKGEPNIPENNHNAIGETKKAPTPPIYRDAERTQRRDPKSFAHCQHYSNTKDTQLTVRKNIAETFAGVLQTFRGLCSFWRIRKHCARSDPIVGSYLQPVTACMPVKCKNVAAIIDAMLAAVIT
jgi:hypothetical protein